MFVSGLDIGAPEPDSSPLNPAHVPEPSFTPPRRASVAYAYLTKAEGRLHGPRSAPCVKRWQPRIGSPHFQTR